MHFKKNLITVAGGIAYIAIVLIWASRTFSPVLLGAQSETTITSHWGMVDFREGVYFPARAMLDGRNPYNWSQFVGTYPVDFGFPLYSPSFLLLNLPFALLSCRISELLYFSLTVLLISLFSFMVLKISGITPTIARVLWLSALIAAGRPVYGILTLGQSTMFIGLGVLLALHWARNRPVIGGLGLALATMKPTFGIPLTILLLVRRDFLAVGIGLAIGGVSALIPAVAVVTAAGGIPAFIAAVRENIAAFQSLPANALDGGSWMRIDASVVMARLFNLPVFSGFEILVALLCIASAGVAVHRLRAAPHETSGRGFSSTLILFSTLLAFYHQVYDATLVALPIVLAIASRKEPWQGLSLRTRAIIGVPLVILWFNFLATDVVLRILGLTPNEIGWKIVTSLNSALLLSSFIALLVISHNPPSTTRRNG